MARNLRISITNFVLILLISLAGRAAGQVVDPPRPPEADPHAPSTPAPTSAPSVVLKPGEKSDIEFLNLIYDWGREKGASTVKHDFIFTNKGNGTLEILNVRPSCSCTVATEYIRVIEPGGTGRIPVELSTGSHVGHMTKTINVETNCEGDKKTVTLTMQGEVWQVIQVEPGNVAFNRLEEQIETEKILKIQSNVDAPLELADVASSNKTFVPSLREKVPGKIYELVVKAVPPFSPGANTGRITLKTNYPEKPTLEIHAFAYAPEIIEVTPTTITVPMGSLKPTKRKVQVKCHQSKPLKISNPQATTAGVKCQINELQPGKVYELVVDFPPGFKAAPTGERVTIKTDNEQVPLVNIPITMQGGSSIGPLPGMVRPQAKPAAPAAQPEAGAATATTQTAQP